MQYKFTVEVFTDEMNTLQSHEAVHEVIDAINDTAEVIDFEEVAE